MTQIISLVLLLIIIGSMGFVFIESFKFEAVAFKKVSIKETSYLYLMGLILSFIMAMILTLVTKTFPNNEYIQQYNTYVQSNRNAFQTGSLRIIGAILISPILEEVIFRGVLIRGLKRKFNFVNSIIIASLIFGIMHGNVVQGIYAYLFGLVLSIICYNDKTDEGNITKPIIFHIGFNMAGVLISQI